MHFHKLCIHALKSKVDQQHKAASFLVFPLNCAILAQKRLQFMKNEAAESAVVNHNKC